MRSSRALPLLVLAACGDPDPDQPVDAAIEVDAPALPSGCDYAELRDATNDDVPPAMGTPEPTGLVFGTRTVLCGTIDSTHFDGDITVDVDGFVVTLAADAEVLVRIHGAGITGPELVGVDVYTGAALDTFVGSSTVYGSHGVTALHLPAGTYELAAFALNSAGITAPIPYKLELVTDAPATRCPEVTTGGYPEANDGTNHDGNDVIRIASGSPPALTAAPADLPEPTQLVIAPATNDRVTGSLADITSPDLYEDIDTFAFTTGATTNELAVRLSWPGTTADLDYLLFEAATTDPVVRAISAANQPPEQRTFAIKPSTSYWLLVGAKLASTPLPAAYTASLCGASFTP